MSDRNSHYAKDGHQRLTGKKQLWALLSIHQLKNTPLQLCRTAFAQRGVGGGCPWGQWPMDQVPFRPQGRGGGIVDYQHLGYCDHVKASLCAACCLCDRSLVTLEETLPALPSHPAFCHAVPWRQLPVHRCCEERGHTPDTARGFHWLYRCILPKLGNWAASVHRAKGEVRALMGCSF